MYSYECGYICLKMGILKQPEAEQCINVCTGDYKRKRETDFTDIMAFYKDLRKSHLIFPELLFLWGQGEQ